MVAVSQALASIRVGNCRYALYAARGAQPASGRALRGSDAARVLARALQSEDANQVRRAYALLSSDSVPATLGNHEVLRWFEARLGRDSTGADASGLVLVELCSGGAAAAGAQPSMAPADRVVKELAAQIGVDLNYAGTSYRLATVESRSSHSSLVSYETLSTREAAQVLDAMAAQPAQDERRRALLQEARELAQDRPREPASLVMLRRTRQLALTDASSQTLTPSQLRKAAATDWLEIRLIDDTGQPIANEPFEVRLPDGSTQQGTLDENGMAYVSGFPPGTCEVSFPGFRPHVAA